MKNLKELEQKYLELGKEIEALKKQSKEEEFEYPIYRDWETDRKSTRLNSSHSAKSRMPSSA